MSEKNDFQEHLEGWFAGRLPGEWFTAAPEVAFDRDEILIVGALSEPDLASDAGPETRKAANEARIQGSGRTPGAIGCGSRMRPSAGSAGR